VIWIHEEAEALEDDHGDPVYLQGVMYDVTEQKLAEAQLVKALHAEKEAAAGLRVLQEMQNSFLQAVSHDLRTPLTSILGCALTLEGSLEQESLSRDDEHDLIGRIAANSRKLHRLLTNLLDLDRMSRGIVAPNRDAVDVLDILTRVVQECSTETHPIELITTEPVPAHVDAAQVERIVENLVANAIRYTPNGTPIWVDATSDGESVLLVVEDAGPGVPVELRGSIFEPFRQGNEVISHSPGVGIGLSLVTRFAELHGGRAWVEDRDGGGASFRVYLPFGTPEELDDEERGSLVAQSSDGSRSA
jgi:K+-sensing histidine kinase KdpD